MNQGISRKHAANRWQAQLHGFAPSEISGKKGGTSRIRGRRPRNHRIFEVELTSAHHCKMKNMVPWCSGEPGAESVKVNYPDEHGEIS